MDKEPAEANGNEDGILPPKPVRDRFVAGMSFDTYAHMVLVYLSDEAAITTSGYSPRCAGKQLARQNILVSATLNAKVKSLAKLSLQHPTTIAVDGKHDNVRKAMEEYVDPSLAWFLMGVCLLGSLGIVILALE